MATMDLYGQRLLNTYKIMFSKINTELIFIPAQFCQLVSPSFRSCRLPLCYYRQFPSRGSRTLVSVESYKIIYKESKNYTNLMNELSLCMHTRNFDNLHLKIDQKVVSLRPDQLLCRGSRSLQNLVAIFQRYN